MLYMYNVSLTQLYADPWGGKEGRMERVELATLPRFFGSFENSLPVLIAQNFGVGTISYYSVEHYYES